MCRAANALRTDRLKWLELALNDADLQRVLVRWNELPQAIKAAIVVIVRSQFT
jgi:hypothetical protein